MSDFFDNLLTGFSTPAGATSLVGGLLSAAGNIGAGVIKSDATNDAIGTLQKNAAQGEGFIDAGTGGYASTIQPLMTQQPIMLPLTRGLTQQQLLGEADLQRQNEAALDASGLRGAGRAGISSLEDSNNRYESSARAANDQQNLAAMQAAQGVQNQARTGLANTLAAAGTAKANTAIGTGSQIAGYQNQGGVGQAAALTGAAGNVIPTIGAASVYGANPTSAAANLTTAPSSSSFASPSTVPLAQLGGDPNQGGLPASAYGGQTAGGIGGTYGAGGI